MAAGVELFLQRLRELGILTAVASSSDAVVIQSTLKHGRMAHLFDVVIGGDEVSRGKPDPEIFLLAAARVGVPPPACVVIEDSPHGIAAARAAGMPCVRVVTSTTRHLTCPAADLEIGSFEKLEAGHVLGLGAVPPMAF
jgi:HAD superfamily hydrolase (TIGR01509 family)